MTRPVPVLMYHHVNHHRGDLVTVTPDVFEGQMRYLSRAGFETLTPDQLLDFAEGRFRPRRKAVLVTFDDGWLDNYRHAYPVLAREGLKATVFVVTDTVAEAKASDGDIPRETPTHRESKALIRDGRSDLVTLRWEHMREMTATGLFEFQSHTKTHRECHGLNEDELYEELGGSKWAIEQNLDLRCRHLCWPRGKFNRLAVRVAQEVGYRGLFTTRPGVVWPGSDPLAVERIVVKDSLPWFRARMITYTSPVLGPLYLRLRGKRTQAG